MKATIKGIEVSGTPEEIAEFISLSKPEIITASNDYEELSIGDVTLRVTKCPCGGYCGN